MKDYRMVANPVIKRLPQYRRTLGDYLRRGVRSVTSTKLGEEIGFSTSQIRKDLTNFGTFGISGLGYNVEKLYMKVNGILGLENIYKLIIVGIVNLGQAVANYRCYP